MKIIVCIKQVPDTQNVNVDPVTGVLLRDGVESKMNPYDLFALESALLLKNNPVVSEVIALTMGPISSKEILYEALAMGVDKGYLLSDKAFGGADVYATSYTLAQGIKLIGDYDLIICGKQTTDGDTAQVGPSLAMHLKLPAVTWLKSIDELSKENISFTYQLDDSVVRGMMDFPCLISVEKDIVVTRLPSYRYKIKIQESQITVFNLDDLIDKDPDHYGLLASKTQVERIFAPEKNQLVQKFTGDSGELADKLYELLKLEKFI